MSAAAINCFKFSFLDGKRKRIKNLRLSSKNPAKNRTFTNRKKMPFLLEKKSDGRNSVRRYYQCAYGSNGTRRTRVLAVCL